MDNAVNNIAYKLKLLWRLGLVFRRTQVNVMLKYLDLNNARKILDAGCGQGLVSYEIATINSKAELVLLDISYSDLLIAKNVLKQQEPRVHLINASITHLPFRNNSFDRMLLSSVLQHIPNYDQALAESSRIVTSNGILVVNVPSRENYAYLPQLLGRKIITRLHKLYSMIRGFNPKELIQKLLVHGFKPIDYQFKPGLLTMLVFEVTSILRLIDPRTLNRIILILSVFYPLTTWIEEKLGLTTGTEYIVKAIKKT